MTSQNLHRERKLPMPLSEGSKIMVKSRSFKTSDKLFVHKSNVMAFQVKEKLNDNSFESKAGFDTWGAKVSLNHLDIML